MTNYATPDRERLKEVVQNMTIEDWYMPTLYRLAAKNLVADGGRLEWDELACDWKAVQPTSPSSKL